MRFRHARLEVVPTLILEQRTVPLRVARRVPFGMVCGLMLVAATAAALASSGFHAEAYCGAVMSLVIHT
jgi:hypothetical protein